MRAQSADKKARRALNEAYFARKDFLDEHIQNADPILLAHSILVAGDGEALKSITPKLVAAKEKVSQLEELVHAMAPHVRHPGVAASLEGHNADLVEARKNANTLQADFDHAVHVARGEIKDEHFYAIYEAVNELDGPTLKDIDTQRDDVDRKLKAHESYFKTERLQIPDKIEDTKVELRKAKRRVSELEAQLSSTTPILRSISID